MGTGGAGKFSCSASNPCTFTQVASQTYTGAPAAQYWYQNKGASYGTAPNKYTLDSGQPTTSVVSDTPGVACTSTKTGSTSSVFGCSSTRPCDLTYKDTQTATTTYPDESWYINKGGSYVSSGRTYTPKAGSPTTQNPSGGTASAAGTLELVRTGASCTGNYTETSRWGCTSSNSCALTFLGTRTGGTSETPIQFCRYSRKVYTYATPATTMSTCRYNLKRYNYTNTTASTYTRCQWRRSVHDYRAPSYTYRWATLGGEITNPVTVLMDSTNAHCTSSPYSGGFSGGSVCPPTLTTSSGVCADSARQCKLRWRTPLSIASTTYSKGRNHYHSGTATDNNKLCRAIDWVPSSGSPVLAQPNPGLYINDNASPAWCQQTGSAITQETQLVSDYYAPLVSNTEVSGHSYSPGLMTRKVAGWSAIPNANSTIRNGMAANTASLQFVPIGASTVPDIMAAMKKHSVTNPAGVRMADVGDHTPLFGTLTNAKEYLQEVVNADPDAECRSYYVLLVTDGQENTPAGYDDNSLVAAVGSLRNQITKGGTTIDVKTFVVGFGNQAVGGGLDRMARAGGTAFPDNTSGSAFSALSKQTLIDTLTQILSTVTAGLFTRSKPVLSLDGSRVYAGYFEHSPDPELSFEWKGYLDAFNIAANGTVSGPVWRYSDQTNTQSSRTLYTRAPLTVGQTNQPLLNLGNTGNSPEDQLAIYSEMGPTLTTAEKDQVFGFIRNDGLNSLFQDGIHRRYSRVSDIYHSVPLVVGAPPFSSKWAGPSPAQQAAFSTYKAAHAGRETTVYIGSNDGMLHAVREDGNASPAAWAGQERWGYAPPAALPAMASSWSSHTFGVDGSATASDICSGNCDQATDWKTVLVGTMRQGGKSVYALDVTAPAAPAHLWDFVDGYMGETWSAPSIARVKVNGSGGITDKWVVLVGGGVSTQDNVGNRFYVLDALGGSVVGDSSGNVASFPVGEGVGPTKNNVPSRPAVFRPSDGPFASAVYFGDTEGRLSRMDMNGTEVSDWAPVTFFDPANTACQGDAFGNSAAPIVLASTGATGSPATLPLSIGQRQPIYNKPLMAFDSAGRINLFVGTGDTTAPTVMNGTKNYFYAIRDIGTNGICSGQPVWIKEFAPDEKVLSEPAMLGDVVVVGTYVPPGPGEGCRLAGSSKLYAFAAATGAPKAALVDPVTGAAANTVTLQNSGLISDLFVVGTNLVYNTSNSPNAPAAVGLTNVSTGNKLKGWRRVR